MSFCYVVMAHTAPDQVEHTVRRIRALSPGAHVLVRHATAGVFDAARLEAAGARVLHSRIRVHWGDWSLVRAAVEALETAVRTTDADHVVLVSGQDYPIRDLAEWERQVGDTDALLDVFPPLPDDWSYSWRRVSPPRRGIPTPVRRAAKGAWRRTARPLSAWVLFYEFNDDPRWYLGLRRFRTGPLPVVKGSLWMTLSRRAVEEVLTRHGDDPATRGWFEHVRIPDESYLQSLVRSVPGLRVITCPTTHARFRHGNPNAVALDSTELRLAAAGPAAFARKLTELDPQLVAAADALAARPAAECPPVRDRDPGEHPLTGPENAAGAWDALLATASVAGRAPRPVSDAGVATPAPVG